MTHRFLILFLLLSYLGISQTQIPLAGFKATLNTFPTISGDTMTATFTLLDVSNQFNGISLKTRDSLVIWKNCKRYRIDTVLTAFATQVTVKLLKGGNPSLTPGICALVEETKTNKSFAPFSITDGERQCIQSYYVGKDTIAPKIYVDSIFINDSLFYVIDGDTINAGYVNTTPLKVKDTPTMKLRIVSDTLRADIKKRLNAGTVGGSDKFLVIQYDSTGQITAISQLLSDDFDKDPFNEFQNIVIDSVGRRFTIGITDGNEVSFIDQVGITDTTYINQLISDSIAAIVFPKDSLYTNGDPGHISIIGGNEVDINVNDADSNPTNEIQTLSFSMPNLSIGGGNTVNLTGLINDADSNPYNELQTISIIDSTDRVFQIRLHPENQLIKFRDSVGLTEMDTSLISQIISDSLSTYVFETDTSLINQLISDSLATINQDQIVSLTGAGITNVTGTYPNFTITSTEVDGSTTNEIQTLSQSFTGTTEATYTLSNSGGSVKDTTGFMRLETMFSTPGSRTYRYKSNLGAILGITEDPLLGGNSNIEVLRTGNQLTWGLRKDNASNGQIYKYNGTAWALSSDASGITSLNGLTPSTQTFATGTSGTDFNISSSTSTHTLNLPTASASNRGLLSSANWTTFNNKFTLPSLTSGSVLFSNGSTISQDNSSFFWDDTNNRLGLGRNSSLTARLTLEDAGGLSVNKVIAFQNSGGWGNTWISKFNDVGSRRGLHISGDNISSGETTAMTVDHFNGAKVGINNTTPTSLLHIGNATDDNGITIDRGVNASTSTKLIVNSEGDLIFRNNNGHMSIGTFSENLSYYNPSAKLHLFGPAGTGIEDMIKIERAGGYGSTVFRQYYIAGTSKYGLHIGNGYSATNYLTLQHNDGFVGVGVDIPTRKLDVNGGLRIRDVATTTPTKLMSIDNDGVVSSLGLSGLSISGGNLVGAAPLSGTTGTIPYWTSSTGIGSTPFTYASNIMTLPTGNSIYFPGTSTIIDKNNSGGSAGEILSRAASGGGMDWVAAPVGAMTVRNGVSGTSQVLTMDGSVLMDIQAGTGITVTTNLPNATNPIFSISATGTNLGINPKSGTDITITSSTGNDVIVRDGFGITNTTATGAIVNTLASPYTLMGASSISQALTTTYAKLAIGGSSSYNGDGLNITFDNTNDEFDILATGDYHISYKCNCKSTNASVAVIFDLIDNVTSGSLGCISSHYFDNTNEYCHNSSEWINLMSSGSRFSLYAKTASGTTTITDCNVRVFAQRVK